MHLTLPQIKKHLNVEPTFTDDDLYIVELADAAELVVETELGYKLSTVEEDNCLPGPIQQAILLLVGHWYASREPVAFTSCNEVPLTYRYLIELFKNEYKQF